MIKQGKDGNDVWTPKQILTDSEIKNIRKAHREKFKFLQEDDDTNGKNKRNVIDNIISETKEDEEND